VVISVTDDLVFGGSVPDCGVWTKVTGNLRCFGLISAARVPYVVSRRLEKVVTAGDGRFCVWPSADVSRGWVVGFSGRRGVWMER